MYQRSWSLMGKVSILWSNAPEKYLTVYSVHQFAAGHVCRPARTFLFATDLSHCTRLNARVGSQKMLRQKGTVTLVSGK